jgi:hypothetical protein
MGKTFYHCPLCKNQSAYISEYGMQDSVICKCQGLNEVGRLVNGHYVPHNIQAKAPAPPPPPTAKTGVASNGQPYVHPTLPHGHGNKPATPQGQVIQTGSFLIYHLSLESEIEAAGYYFNNALQSPAPRQRYMQMGEIYYAEHNDENRSLMFYVDKVTKEAVNFYGKDNGTPHLHDIDEVKLALRRQGLIKN